MNFEVSLPVAVVDEIVERVADLVLARLAPSSTPASEFCTVTEAADVLRSSKQRVYDLLSDGRLTRHKDGSRVLVSRAELVAHLWPRGSQSPKKTGVLR